MAIVPCSLALYSIPADQLGEDKSTDHVDIIFTILSHVEGTLPIAREEIPQRYTTDSFLSNLK